jgi:hypothetical protein
VNEHRRTRLTRRHRIISTSDPPYDSRRSPRRHPPRIATTSTSSTNFRASTLHPTSLHSALAKHRQTQHHQTSQQPMASSHPQPLSPSQSELSDEETLSPLEQEVLDEYARLLGNLNNVSPFITTLYPQAHLLSLSPSPSSPFSYPRSSPHLTFPLPLHLTSTVPPS